MQDKLDNAEGLRSLIETAFAEVAYPGDDAITISSCPCTECEDTREFFRGKHWQEIADAQKLMQYCWGGLSILSPQAWHFYLPTYLIIGIDGDVEDYEDIENYLQMCPTEEARETLICNLSPLGRTGHRVKWFEERVALLSEEQRKCLEVYTAQVYASGVIEWADEIWPTAEEWKAVADFWEQLASR